MGWDVLGYPGMSQVILGPTEHVRLGTCAGIICWDVTPQDVLGCPGMLDETYGGIMGWDVPGYPRMSQVILGPPGHVRPEEVLWDGMSQDTPGCPK